MIMKAFTSICGTISLIIETVLNRSSQFLVHLTFVFPIVFPIQPETLVKISIIVMKLITTTALGASPSQAPLRFSILRLRQRHAL